MTPGASSATGLPRRFERHVRDDGLLAADDHVLVALSGGIDSMVLLDLLRRCGFAISAAHFDHALRADSAQDAAWVAEVCARLDVALIAARADVPARAEADAREQRYAFLQEAASRARASAIVTAHHANDQAETLLFRLARGTGMHGLAGIPARRGIIVRPLLPFTRAEIRRHAESAGLEWREDPTNAQLRFARNRIRHRVLPSLERIRPGATRHIAELAARVAEAETAWREVLRGVAADVVTGREPWGYALARDRILAYHPHVRARVIRQLFGELGSRPDRSVTRFALRFIETGASGGSIQLPGGLRLDREFDRLLLRRPGSGPDRDDVAVRISGPEMGAGTLVAGGRTYEARWAQVPGSPGPGERASFDLSSLRFPLELRGWHAGDRIRLAGGTRKLKKLFQEKRVARGLRSSVPMLSDSAGEVLWAVGLARSERFPPVAGAPVFEIAVIDVSTS